MQRKAWVLGVTCGRVEQGHGCNAQGCDEELRDRRHRERFREHSGDRAGDPKKDEDSDRPREWRHKRVRLQPVHRRNEKTRRCVELVENGGRRAIDVGPAEEALPVVFEDLREVVSCQMVLAPEWFASGEDAACVTAEESASGVTGSDRCKGSYQEDGVLGPVRGGPDPNGGCSDPPELQENQYPSSQCIRPIRGARRSSKYDRNVDTADVCLYRRPAAILRGLSSQ